MKARVIEAQQRAVAGSAAAEPCCTLAISRLTSRTQPRPGTVTLNFVPSSMATASVTSGTPPSDSLALAAPAPPAFLRFFDGGLLEESSSSSSPSSPPSAGRRAVMNASVSGSRNATAKACHAACVVACVVTSVRRLANTAAAEGSLP